MKFVISDPKSGRAYSATSEQPMFIGKKMGEVVQLDALGLTGFEAKISGGSGNQGFPMHQSIVGTTVKKIFTSSGVGFKAKHKGEKKRVSVRGNTIEKDIAQVNLVVTKNGSVLINEVLKGKPLTEEEALSAKERLIKKSLAQAGSAELGSGVKKAKH
jgi:small subunit ribosomal protein S6e